MRKMNEDLFLKAEYDNNKALILENGECVTYEKLREMTNDLYKHINERCLVFCLCDNSYECIMAYISFINNKVVPLLLSTDISCETLQCMIELYKPTYLWMPQKKYMNISNTVILSKIKEKCKFSEYGLYKICYKTNSTNKNSREYIHKELAVLLTTSGSTGSSKLVRVSYKNLFSNAISIIEYLNISSKDTTITVLPFFYAYGLSVINSHIMAGACIVLNNRSVMDIEFWNKFNKNKVVSFAGVPYTFELLDRMNFYRMNLPELKYYTQAGGRLSTKLQEKFAQYALENEKKFYVMYGQTEATARIAYLPCEDCCTKIGSVGKAIPGGYIELINEGKVVSKAKAQGELVYKGPNVTLGYAYEFEDLNKGDEWNGKLYTGDIAEYDEDGYLYIVGRKTRFIKIHGKRINLDDIEKLMIN